MVMSINTMIVCWIFLFNRSSDKHNNDEILEAFCDKSKFSVNNCILKNTRIPFNLLQQFLTNQVIWFIFPLTFPPHLFRNQHPRQWEHIYYFNSKFKTLKAHDLKYIMVMSFSGLWFCSLTNSLLFILFYFWSTSF